MKWEEQFAARTERIKSSTVREFLKHALKPGMISFAGGMPDPNLLPVQATAAASERIGKKYGAKALQYGQTEGIGELRELIAARFGKSGATAENVLITTGSQQALDLIGRVLLEEGDPVAVQNPTYLAALAAWRPYGVEFVTGESGWPLPETETRRPSLVYCIPNFQNPSGGSLSREERMRLTEYAGTRGVPLIEDDPYGELRYEGEALPSLLEMGSDLSGPILYVGTFSKVLAPGFRLGWIVGAPPLIKALAQAKQAMDLHTSTFCQYLALELLNDRSMAASIQRLCAAYRKKRDVMLEELREHMPGSAHWTEPAGGFFILLTLSKEMDGTELAQRALEEQVVVVPGIDFHVRGGKNTLRLSFSSAGEEEIRTGIRALARCVREKAPLDSRRAEAPALFAALQ